MKNFIIAIIILLAAITVMATGMEFLFHGGFVPKKTEAKYLRNINKYELINSNYFYVSIFTRGDTLAGYISDNTYYPINALSKWHIGDIGLIRRGGKLHKKLDSLASLWVDKESKYK